MKLVFIRHAEPDYSVDSLTEKGFREAELLGIRTASWKVDQFYCSPYGRAQDTARPTLTARGISLTSHYPEFPEDRIITPDSSKAIVYPWLREIEAPVDSNTHPDHKGIVWDLTPQYLNEHPQLFDAEDWRSVPFVSASDYENQYNWISTRLDELLRLHGYDREGVYYRTDKSHGTSNSFMQYNGTTAQCLKDADASEPVLVFFCHMGVMFTMISHLIHMSPFTMLHGFFGPPASVTVLSAEERTPGQAYFRVQMLGDTSHLREQGEPTSFYGGFAAPFQF